MKYKLIILILFLLIMLKASAETTFRIPADFLTDITKSVEFKTDLNVLERLLVNQIVKNSSLNGVKLKDFTTQNLIKYFNEDNLFEQLGTNKLVEKTTGATLEFNSDNECKKNNCTITIDLNGDKGPNEVWTNMATPKDRIIFTIKRNSDDSIDIIIPDFSYGF